jgi:hypothetical protein
MSDSLLISSTFPMARCISCQKDVLTCVTFDDAGLEYRACAHCDTPIAGELSWVSATELESTGYQIGQRRATTGGCGCGSGGCRIRKS